MPGPIPPFLQKYQKTLSILEHFGGFLEQFEAVWRTLEQFEECFGACLEYFGTFFTAFWSILAAFFGHFDVFERFVPFGAFWNILESLKILDI